MDKNFFFGILMIFRLIWIDIVISKCSDIHVSRNRARSYNVWYNFWLITWFSSPLWNGKIMTYCQEDDNWVNNGLLITNKLFLFLVCIMIHLSILLNGDKNITAFLHTFLCNCTFTKLKKTFIASAWYLFCNMTKDRMWLYLRIGRYTCYNSNPLDHVGM